MGSQERTKSNDDDDATSQVSRTRRQDDGEAGRQAGVSA